MDTSGSSRLLVRRRLPALWVLLLFLLGQAVPVVALAATDGMAGMVCCKHGRDSCCRRKPTPSTPALRAGHICGMPCAGTPTVSQSMDAGVAAPMAQHCWTLSEACVIRPERARGQNSFGYDAVLFQRPPPFLN